MNSRHVSIGIGVMLLVAAPVLLSQGLVNAAIQMLIAALFASAYNLLCGQGGMLSFGHAAYFATQRTGTYFAMITLAIAELLHSLAPHLKGLFGGEAGVSAMRMPSMGLTFGSTTQVYYLTLAWVLASVALLYLYTRTPVGRLTLGLRENGHRLRFLGYDTHRLGVLVFAISGLFSGVAGGLQVINNEAANYVLFDPGLSAAVVLNTFIGGVSVFLGPALGASLMTFFGYAVSDLTQSWLLYQGILFVLVMMFMPAGLAGLFGTSAELRRRHGTVALVPLFVVSVVAAVLLSAGGAFLVELLQRLFSQDYRALASAAASAPWPPVRLLGMDWSPASALTWLVPVGLLGAGTALACQARHTLRGLERRREAAVPAHATPDPSSNAAVQAARSIA